MAAVPIKFRCHHCNQLLGVGRGKVGEVVNCPKCSAELIVPAPIEAPPAPEPATISGGAAPTAQSGPTSAEAGDYESDIAHEFLDIRPEDIRVEAGVVPVMPPPYRSAPPPPVTDPEAETEVDVEQWRVEVEAAEAPTTLSSRRDETVQSPARRTIVEPVPGIPPVPPAPPKAEEPAPEPDLPAIHTNEPLRVDVPRRVVAPPPRSRDLVIPRSVVSAWSLLVLSAIGFAFFTGLLAGHYIWRVH